MLSWTAIERAIVNHVKAATGIEVIFADQVGEQPLMPYATIKINGPRALSPQPEILLGYDSGAPAGQEVTQTVILHGEIQVSIQTYSQITAGAGTARELLEQVRRTLFLPGRRDLLSAAGLALLAASDTQDLSVLLEATWQSRAAMDVRFNMVDDSAKDSTGYIATANVTGSA